LRRRVKGTETPDIYQLKRESLGELETLAEEQKIDLYYADEAAVSLDPCVPYAWQFKDEQAFMPSEKGKGVNCFALLARDNRAVIETTTQTMTSQFLCEQIERFSMGLQKLTVVVWDNAAVHRARIIKERLGVWQQRGLFLFYLPRYSPHLNIVEVLWRKLKYEWLTAKDYETGETLRYAVRLALKAVGESLRINFSGFNHSLL
jgi:transposase